MDVLAYNSFQELVSDRDIKPRAFKSNLEAMEAVELMATTIQLGDLVLACRRRGQITAEHAQTLLLDLIICFDNPIQHAKRVIEVGRELRGYEE
ncbi:MAG: hypothetical protein WCD76_03675 [Pyrinomonadaceae bacterium]